jgi:DNA polymerase-3 subunit delta'
MAELFADLLGQERAVALLQAAIVQRRLAPAYLLAGPEGVGRSLAALRFLEGVLAGPGGSAHERRRLAEGNHPDLLWLEPTYSDKGELIPASKAEALGVNRRTLPQMRLEQIREVSRFLARRPVEAPGCLVVLEGVEAMAEGAANALLKTLEEPGAGLMLLITAAPEQLLGTIRSRCQQIPFMRLAPGPLQAVLQRCAAERPPLSGPQSNAQADHQPDLQSEHQPDPEQADPPELLELAAGSPGALLRHRRQWRALPLGMGERLMGLAPEPLAALELARELSELLDGEQQLWLIDWWQLALWRRSADPLPLRRLERLRQQLRAYVQPRLAWEVALLDLAQLASARA